MQLHHSAIQPDELAMSSLIMGADASIFRRFAKRSTNMTLKLMKHGVTEGVTENEYLSCRISDFDCRMQRIGIPNPFCAPRRPRFARGGSSAAAAARPSQHAKAPGCSKRLLADQAA
jgi:hypothetical protein